MDFKFLLLTVCVVVHTAHSAPPPGINVAKDAAGLEEKRVEVLERLEKVLKQLREEELNMHPNSDATDKLSVDEALESTKELSDTDLSEVLKADDVAEKAADTSTAEAKPGAKAEETFKIKDFEDGGKYWQSIAATTEAPATTEAAEVASHVAAADADDATENEQRKAFVNVLTDTIFERLKAGQVAFPRTLGDRISHPSVNAGNPGNVEQIPAQSAVGKPVHASVHKDMTPVASQTHKQESKQDMVAAHEKFIQMLTQSIYKRIMAEQALNKADHSSDAAEQSSKVNVAAPAPSKQQQQQQLMDADSMQQQQQAVNVAEADQKTVSAHDQDTQDLLADLTW
ncbi:uncharacterized protein LOC135809467 [Sycon ciliatum]|uniref:uncharacterized protein LOC135809467 n=1 Tax=Sycon ciliatum TaxID=27933 RepID=UPI0020ABDFBB